MMYRRYSRLLARYPHVILAVVAVLTLTCIIVAFTFSPMPGFADPKLGFVARGTKLSGRSLSYKKLLEETRGMLDPPTTTDYSISAADLGTEREWAMRNLSLQASRARENAADNSQPGRRREKADGINQNQNEAPRAHETAVESIFDDNDDDGISPSSETPMGSNRGRKRILHSQARGEPIAGKGAVDLININTETVLKDVRDRDRDQTARKREKNEQEEEDEDETRFFCDVPRVEYARYTFQHINRSDLFTFEHIQASCLLDKQIRKLPSFSEACLLKEESSTTSRTNAQSTAPQHSCCRTWSLSNYVALFSNRSSCEEVSVDDVIAVRAMLGECARWRENGALAQCRDVETARRRTETCSLVPRACLQADGAVVDFFTYIADTGFVASVPDSSLTYAMSFIPLASGIGTEPLYHDIEQKPDLEQGAVRIIAINFGLKDALFDHYLRKDGLWFIGAVGAVVFVMLLYTQSVFLTVMASLSTIMSLLISYCLYTVVYGIEFFPYMNLLAVVLLIGIGADDVFLYCRVWYLAKLEKNVGTLTKLVSDTVRHAGLSMFVTSFTTAAALLASSVSHVTALRCFAVFASTTVMVNFLMMLTWLPAALVVHDKWCAHNCLCCTHPHTSYDNPGPLYYICLVQATVHKTLTNWARTFFEKVLPYLIMKLRYLWLFVLGVIGVIAMFIVLYYPKLKLPTSSEFQIFALSHPFEVYDYEMKDKFWFEKVVAAGAINMPITIVWGVKAQDTGNKFDPYSSTELKLDPTFNLATMDAQRTLLRICRDLRFNQWYQDTLGPQFTNCFIEPFKQFMERDCVDRYSGDVLTPCCKSSEFPYPEDVFKLCLAEWQTAVQPSKNFFYMNEQAGPRYDRETGEIVALVVEVASRQPYSFRYEEIKYFHSTLDEWLQSQLVRAPQEISSAWFLSDLGFYDLQSSIAHGTPVSICVSIAIATVVAFCTTLNVLITLWAMVSIAATVFVVVALLILIGWELNIMESVTLTVAVGLAMDFALHYGMGYRLSPDSERYARVHCSTSRIASPVAMAALSTFLAGAFVLPSTIQAYRQLGIFLMILMTISWVYATFFFQSLLRCVGPIGSFSQFNWPVSECRCCCCYCYKQQKPVRKDKTMYTRSESTYSSVSSSNPAPGCGVGTSTSEAHELEPLAEEEISADSSELDSGAMHSHKPTHDTPTTGCKDPTVPNAAQLASSCHSTPTQNRILHNSTNMSPNRGRYQHMSDTESPVSVSNQSEKCTQLSQSTELSGSLNDFNDCQDAVNGHFESDQFRGDSSCNTSPALTPEKSLHSNNAQHCPKQTVENGLHSVDVHHNDGTVESNRQIELLPINCAQSKSEPKFYKEPICDKNRNVEINGEPVWVKRASFLEV